MRIVFGVRHFKLKSYSIKELGLSEEEIENITIERRQRYFHLYWIPLFATGKMWAIRKEDKLYDLPPEYMAAIAKKELKHRTPFYTFALPLLLALGLIIYLIAEEVDSYASKKRAQERFNIELAVLNERIANPDLNDFYKFYGFKNYSGDIYLKVRAIKEGSVLFQLPETKPKWYSGSSGELASYFPDTPDSSNLTWIPLSDLKNYIKNDYTDNTFHGNSLPFNKDSEMYRLEEIFHFQGPEFIDTGEGNMANNILSITIKNKGLSTSITEIKNIESNVEWLMELPLLVSANKKFTIEGYYENLPDYNIEITCVDLDSTLYKYSVKGKGISRTLNQF